MIKTYFKEVINILDQDMTFLREPFDISPTRLTQGDLS